MTTTLDPKSIAELVDLGGPEFLTQVLETFDRNLHGQVEEVRRAATEGKLDALGRAAHRLKGSCASVGAHDAAAICFAIERRARGLTQEDWVALVQKLDDELERVTRAVHAHLPTATEP